MDFNIKIHLYEHFIHLNSVYPLSKDYYSEVADDSEPLYSFTYYDYLYRDIGDFGFQLHENNVTNIDAQFILSEYVKSILFKKTYSKETIKYTEQDLIDLQNYGTQEDDFVNYALERIFERVSSPLIFFKDLFMISHPSLKKYPLEYVPNHFNVKEVVASHLSYLPFVAFSRYIDLDRTFESIEEVVTWEKELFKKLIQCERLNEFIEMRQFVYSILEKINYLSELYPDIGSYIYQLERGNNNLQEQVNNAQRRTAFMNVNNHFFAPELSIAHHVWNFIYNEENTLNPNLSHTSKVERVLKVLSKGNSNSNFRLPSDKRFVDRIASISAPKSVKNFKGWDDFYEGLNSK